MATTRIIPLHTGKGRTVGKAISDIIGYVKNPEKTDHGRLITSYQCDSRVADAQFLLDKQTYAARTGRVRGADDVIAYHLRQSFVPGEITPEEANRLGVELGVITGRDCETTYGFPANNKSVLEFCRAYPQKFIGFWGIDPHKKMAAVREIEHVVKDYGMKGIAIDPYLARMPASEARFYPLYSKCCELGVPVFITMAPPPQVPGAILEYADPRDVDKVARDFPELTLIMSHGGYPFVNEAIYTCLRNANVYMDISEYERAPMVDIYVRAMNDLISDKVLFASAHPFVELADALDAYADFELSADVRNKVMYENARRVLRLA